MSKNIFLFIPNLIGYGRIILALISFYLMRKNYVWAATLYSSSCLLDAVDGYAARIFNQGTKFGGMLDQLTDRCATLGLIFAIGSFYPQYILFFQIYMITDVCSHWLHLQSYAMCGKSSHKLIDENEFPLLKSYYSSRIFLFLICAYNEIFFISLYLLNFTEGPFMGNYNLGLFRLMCYVTFPIVVAKFVISLLQGYSAITNLIALDEKLKVTKYN